jgi:hypothetical protein
MTDTGKLEALAGAIKTAFPDAIMGTRLVLGELTVMVDGPASRRLLNTA